MTAEESGGDAAQQGNDPAKKDGDIFEEQGPKKLIRLFTVVAYMFSVSFMGIVLSAYYIFLWEPPNPRLIRRNFYISTEPEVEFLIQEPRSSLSDAVGPSDFSRNLTSRNLFRELAALSNNSQKPIEGRIILKAMGPVAEDNNNHHAKLNESLSLLKNERRVLSEDRARDAMLETNNIEDGVSSVSIEMKKKKVKMDMDTRTVAPTMDSTPVTTISEDEIGKNDTRFEALLNSNKSRGANLRKRRDRSFPPSVENMSNNWMKDSASFESNGARFPTEIKVGSKSHGREWNVLPLTEHTNIAMIPEDTQIEKVTKLPVPGHPERLEINGTQRPKSLLTMLTESVHPNRIVPSDTPLSSTSEASTEPRLVATNQDSEMINIVEKTNVSVTG